MRRRDTTAPTIRRATRRPTTSRSGALLATLALVVASAGVTLVGTPPASAISALPGQPTIVTAPTGTRWPYLLVTGPDGALWFTNQQNDSIGRITTTGAVTSFRGPGIADPRGIVAGPDGALWFTNHGNDTIGRITTAGVVSGFGGPAVHGPSGIATGPDGALWFTN